MDFDRLAEFIVNHWILTTAFTVVLFLLIGGEVRRRINGIPQIGPAAAIKLINQQDAVVLDIRDDGERKGGYIADSIHIPLRQLGEQVSKLEKYRDRPVVAYCRSGARSMSAASLLRRQGFEQVYNLAGGVMAWESEKLPLKRSKK